MGAMGSISTSKKTIIAVPNKARNQRFLVNSLATIPVQNTTITQLAPINHGVSSFLEALEVQTKTFYKTKFPPKFEIYPVRSRLKVVLMQIQKAKFYASTQQLDRLDPALDTMYIQYNSFLNRIIDLGDELSLEVAED